MDFDIDSDWILIIMSPIIIIFIYPFVFMAALYSCAVFLRVYRRKRRAIFDAYTENFWDGAKQAVAAFVDAHGEYWHGKFNYLNVETRTITSQNRSLTSISLRRCQMRFVFESTNSRVVFCVCSFSKTVLSIHLFYNVSLCTREDLELIFD